jgi:acetylornithine deacetylase/succinyl-diaminopimelate desuccinylase-like protein
MSSAQITAAEAACEAVDREFGDHLEFLRGWLRQPSISGTGEGIAEMAELVRRAIVDDLGGTAAVHETTGHPIVLGRVDVGAERTLLVYGMYDVQPVEGEEWLVPPFEGEEVDLPDFGPCIVARGVMNSKGPLANVITTAKSMLELTGTLPVNLVFLVEGEEELGSVSLPAFVEAHREELACDAVLFPFYAQDRTGKVTMFLGVKGMVFIELAVRGGDWGAPRSRGIHGMNAGWFHNPAWVLADLLHGMLSPDQTRILIEGLNDAVRTPSVEDLELLERLQQTFDPATQLKDYDVARFKYDCGGTELMRRFLLEPSLNINGLVSGDGGENHKTMVPHEARAKIDIRLVPDMTVEHAVDCLRRHVQRRGFGDLVEVNVKSGYPWSKSRLHDNANDALGRAYEAAGVEVEPWPLVPGAAPLYLFTDLLGVGVGMGGMGHGGRQHSPNEYATVEGMRAFEKSMVRFMHALADRPREDSPRKES